MSILQEFYFIKCFTEYYLLLREDLLNYSTRWKQNHSLSHKMTRILGWKFQIKLKTLLDRCLSWMMKKESAGTRYSRLTLSSSTTNLIIQTNNNNILKALLNNNKKSNNKKWFSINRCNNKNIFNNNTFYNNNKTQPITPILILIITLTRTLFNRISTNNSKTNLIIITVYNLKIILINFNENKNIFI